MKTTGGKGRLKWGNADYSEVGGSIIKQYKTEVELWRSYSFGCIKYRIGEKGQSKKGKRQQRTNCSNLRKNERKPSNTRHREQ